MGKGINLTKELKDLYSGNYKILMKEIEDNTNEWKDILFSQIGRINILKMSILSKATYIFSEILIKIPMAFSQNRTYTPKISMEPQKIPHNQSNVEKKNKAGDIKSSDFKLY